MTNKTKKLWISGSGLLLVPACGGILPPATPDPSLLGCYRLETNVPESYADSLGYEGPEALHHSISFLNEGAVVRASPTPCVDHQSQALDLPSHQLI